MSGSILGDQRPRVSDPSNGTGFTNNGWELCIYNEPRTDEDVVLPEANLQLTFAKIHYSRVFEAKWISSGATGILGQLWRTSVQQTIPKTDYEIFDITYEVVLNSDCADDPSCAYPVYLFVPAGIEITLAKYGSPGVIHRRRASWCLRARLRYHFHQQPTRSPPPPKKFRRSMQEAAEEARRRLERLGPGM